MGSKGLRAWASGAIELGAFGLLLWLERRRPLRPPVEPRLRHDARNLAVAAAGAVALRLAERPLVGPLAALVERRRLGLLGRLGLPPWLEAALAVVLMDYTLYVWHVLTHRVPALWRFHAVHHADLDLTASTALRFHFAELALSAPWRAAQVLAIGVAPPSLEAWRTCLFLSVVFHHSNVRLPYEVERRLARFVVTPRMHGIHHSVVREETDSNWSSGLTVWDRLHGTLRLDACPPEVEIGVPEVREPGDARLGRVLAMPFSKK
jgi:sterol desaturase/sphingolipid hydroxylase (fatty acid hydroxylase superfamily)